MPRLMIASPMDDLYGLYMDDNYVALTYGDNIRFSFADRGKAISAHFSANKHGLREIKPAIDEFCRWAFQDYGANMVLATVKKQSVCRLVKRCGFSPVFTKDNCHIYWRKAWAV
jgi:hypothetical protein